jgi:two-component system chemotaxis sensor kinase CheA
LAGGFDERQEMINDFITESTELLDEIEPEIIKMEKVAGDDGAVDDEILNTIFRMFHSIKGMASFLDLQTIMNVTHEAEALLDIFRKGNRPILPEHLEILYKTSDFLRNMLQVIENQTTDSGMEAEAEGIIVQIKQTAVADETDGKAKKSLTAEKIVAENSPSVIEEEAIDDELVVAEGLKIQITPEMVKRFVEESNESFEDAEAAFLEIEKEGSNEYLIENIFRAFHSFKGNSGFFGLADFEKVSHSAEEILQEVRDGKQYDQHLLATGFLSVIDALRSGMQLLLAGEENYLPGGAYLVEQLSKMRAAMDQSIQVTDSKKKKPGVIVEAISDKGDSEVKELVSKQLSGGGNGGGAGNPPATQNAVRVDVEKLDILLDLVGELVIAEAMVAQNPDLVGLQLGRFEKAVLHLTKIVRDIQDVAMSIRMIQLSGVFRKMVRLVRDLAVKEHKKVTLEIIGEETEVDKTIIEQISDPLVHIIRNAVDHGLESTEDRIAAGKEEVGHITLEAKHSAGEVVIVVKDDGKGLNRDKILQKAINKGLVHGDGQELKDDDVWKLVFEPGLSTADQVSSISGRGVGMDVVKRNIEKLHGKIDIRSTPGSGTSIVMRIPLTLAIIDGMIVRVGSNKYALPIVAIRESLRPTKGSVIVQPDGMELVKIRDHMLPVLKLHELFRIRGDFQNLDEGILVVVESENQTCCLFVDELIGQQQIVIKAVNDYLGSVRGVSGFAILGDGEVSMILDVVALISHAEELLAVEKEEVS